MINRVKNAHKISIDAHGYDIETDRKTKQHAAYIKRLFAILAAIMLVVFAGTSCLVGTYEVMAAESVSQQESTKQDEESSGSGSKKYVIDDAGILSTSEENSLTELCKKASDKCHLDVIIITMNKNLDGYPMDTYLRSMLEKQYGYYGTGSNCEAVVYGIDMTSRADRIVTSGRARSDISQSRLDSIREKAENKLADGDYYAGCVKYIKGIEKKLNTSTIDKLTYNMPVKLVISAVIAVVAVLAMMSDAKSKMTVSSTEYTKDHNFDVIDRRDVFINTTVTTRHIERSSGSSGGSSGGGNSGSSGGHF